MATIWSGAYLGTALGFPFAEWLTMRPALGGWPAAFHALGMAGVTWYGIWLLVAYGRPENHPSISKRELTQIVGRLQAELVLEARRGGEWQLPESDLGAPPVPWAALLFHPAALAVYGSHFASNWAFYTLSSWLPQYLEQQLGFSAAASGEVALLPFMAVFAVVTVAGWGADRLIAAGWARLSVRTLMQALGFLLPALCLVGVALARGVGVKLVLLVLAMGASGFGVAGFGSAMLDMTPEFAGVMFGVSNTVATIPGIVSPLLTGDLLESAPAATAWRLVFLLSSAVYGLGFGVWVLAGQSDRVPSMNPSAVKA